MSAPGPRRAPILLVLLVSLPWCSGARGQDPGVPRRAEGTGAARPVDPLDQLVDRAISDTKRRLLSSDVHTPWQIAHGVLALRDEYEILVDGQPTSALEWIASNPTFDGKPWWLKTRWGGKGHPFTEPYHFEGHPNQFLAFFATAGLQEDFAFHVDGETVTIGDMVRNAQKETNDREEITWTLWALSTYLPPDARWISEDQRAWSIERLVRMQIESPVTKAACGGTHGLFAVANALNAHRKTGEPTRGVWMEAHMHLQKYVTIARKMQNRDGSFSANYFKGPEWTRDVDKRISTTGHTLEFLMNALPDEELNQAWVTRAVERVARDLSDYRTRPLEPGGMYHACDALVIYRQRTRPEYAPEPKATPVAEAEPKAPVASEDAPDVVAERDARLTAEPEAVDERDTRPITVPIAEDASLRAGATPAATAQPYPRPEPRATSVLDDFPPAADSPEYVLPVPAVAR